MFEVDYIEYKVIPYAKEMAVYGTDVRNKIKYLIEIVPIKDNDDLEALADRVAEDNCIVLRKA